MPKFEFRVLCADNKESGNYVRGLMTDFENVKLSDSSMACDHVGANIKSSNMAL